MSRKEAEVRKAARGREAAAAERPGAHGYRVWGCECKIPEGTSILVAVPCPHC